MEVAADTRATSLVALEHLLDTRRLAELTVGELIREAGISRATFYKYFESKHAAVAAGVESVMDQIYDLWRPWLERSGPADPVALEELWLHSLARWREHRALLTAGAAAARADAGVSETWSVLMKRYSLGVRDHIERARAAGLAPQEPDSEMLATMLIWLNETAMYLMFAASEWPGVDDARLARALTGIWLRVIYNPGGQPPRMAQVSWLPEPEQAGSASAGAGRRRRRKPELRRAILGATARLLAERPLETFTAEDIADAAGISKQMLYVYFESKHGALAAVADEVLGEMYERRWRRAIEDRELDPPGTAEHFLVTIAGWREHRSILVAAARGWRTHPAVYARWGRRIQRFSSAYAAYITHAQSIGRARRDADAEILAQLLTWHAETIFYLVGAGLAPELDDDQRLAETLSAVWLRAVHGDGSRTN